jgi:hypothetical protein
MITTLHHLHHQVAAFQKEGQEKNIQAKGDMERMGLIDPNPSVTNRTDPNPNVRVTHFRTITAHHMEGEPTK